MSNASSPTYTAFRYMSRFRCIGTACESSCCSGGWQITIDREHYKKTRQALGGSPAGRQEFDSKMKRVKKPTRSDGTYALIVMQSNGDCGFLDGERLCSLQRRHGEGLLSDTCAVYPRTVSSSGQRRELAGVASCPEVARQLLLYPDALELDQVDAASFGRATARKHLDDHPADPYTRYHDELRNLIMDVLSDELYPLSTRLSFVAWFANRTVDFLHRDATSLDEERLLAEVEMIQDPRMRAELHAQFAELPMDASFPSRAVLALLGGRKQVNVFRELLERVLAAYQEATGGSFARAEDDSESKVQDIVRAYGAQQRAWSAYAPRLDGYLTNFAKHYWSREWYAGSPNLLLHQVRLLVRLAAIRFLTFGHPLLVAAQNGSDAEKEDALARAAVEAVHRFTRSYDHSPAFKDLLHERLASAQVTSLAHALCLARF